MHCLPCALTDPPAAGYADVEVLPIENDFWRFYRLVG